MKPEPSITVYLNDDGSAKLFNPSDLTLYCGPNLFYSAAALEAVRRAALEEAADIADTFASVEGIAQAIASIIRSRMKERGNEA